jgi:exosortase H (IPTLxxWG-CTERM-specific)
VRRFPLFFVAILAALFGLQIWAPVREALILPFTEGIATLSAKLIRPFDSGVTSTGRVLHDVSNGFSVVIESGCNGVEASIFLVAAIFAFRAPLGYKLAGAATGLLTIQFLNLVRVISLFYLGQWNRMWFEWAHLYVWQVLIMVDVLAVWLIWLRWIPHGNNASTPALASPAT